MNEAWESVTIGIGFGVGLVAPAPMAIALMMLLLGYFQRGIKRSPLMEYAAGDWLTAAGFVAFLLSGLTSIGLGVLTTHLLQAYMLYTSVHP